MAKYTDRQIAEARAIYELGKPLLQAANETGIPETTLRRFSKSQGWNQGQWRDLANEKSNAINTILKSDEIMAKNLAKVEAEQLDNRIMSMTALKNASIDLQHGMIDLLQKARKQVDKILDNSPDGLYVSAESAQGTQYKRTTEFVKDLIPAMSAANTILGLDKATVEVTNNTQNNISPPSLQIEYVRKDVTGK